MSKRRLSGSRMLLKKHSELDRQYKQREEKFSRFLTLLVGRRPGISENDIYFHSHGIVGKKDLKEKLEQWWKDNPPVKRMVFNFEYYQNPSKQIYEKNGVDTYSPLSFCMTTLLLMYKANREDKLYTDKVLYSKKKDGKKVKLKLDLEDQKAILDEASFWKDYPNNRITLLEYIEELAQ